MIPFVLDGGGSGELILLDGERCQLISTRPAAPGTPLCATLEGESESLELKVNRCSRRPDDRFDIDARLVNLTRTLRTSLAARLG